MSTANQTEGQIPFDHMKAEDWCKFLCEKPQFADKCPWENLTGDDWSELLREQPQFADKNPFQKEQENT